MVLIALLLNATISLFFFKRCKLLTSFLTTGIFQGVGRKSDFVLDKISPDVWQYTLELRTDNKLHDKNVTSITLLFKSISIQINKDSRNKFRVLAMMFHFLKKKKNQWCKVQKKRNCTCLNIIHINYLLSKFSPSNAYRFFIILYSAIYLLIIIQ